MLTFVVGQQYTRKNVQQAVGSPDAKGGLWDTGVVTPKVAGDFVIFANVGGEGSTGHDYPNSWEGSRLRWFHKNRSRIHWPSVQGMLDGSVPVHVFWRRSKEDPLFMYAGLATPVEVKDSSPVEILWSVAAP